MRSDPLPPWLDLLGRIEGLSLLVLIAVAMPLKYLAENPLPVRIGGMLHGLLFLVYSACLLLTALRRRWPLSTLAMGLLLSVLPFGFLLLEDYLPAADTLPDRDSGPLANS